eukprot:2759014-Prymnesium_polylepis.1
MQHASAPGRRSVVVAVICGQRDAERPAPKSRGEPQHAVVVARPRHIAHAEAHLRTDTVERAVPVAREARHELDAMPVINMCRTSQDPKKKKKKKKNACARPALPARCR